jgi:hypothetical protein
MLFVFIYVYWCPMRFPDEMLDLQLHMQTVPITTNVVSSNPAHGEVYSILHFVMKFVIDLRQVGGLPWVVQFYSPIKLTITK